MVNFAKKFKISRSFFLIFRKVTFFSGHNHYFNGKKLRTSFIFQPCAMPQNTAWLIIVHDVEHSRRLVAAGE